LGTGCGLGADLAAAGVAGDGEPGTLGAAGAGSADPQAARLISDVSINTLESLIIMIFSLEYLL
jgi:hypothetical protein